MRVQTINMYKMPRMFSGILYIQSSLLSAIVVSQLVTEKLKWNSDGSIVVTNRKVLEKSREGKASGGLRGVGWARHRDSRLWSHTSVTITCSYTT